MPMKKIIITIFISWTVLLLGSCYYDKEQLLLPPKSSTSTPVCQNYSFTNDVYPLIQSSCANGSGCHGAGSSSGPGELINYTEIKNAGNLMQASILAGRMPLGSRLTSSQVSIITCWVSNGALNN
jgi:hypothetical protein